MYTFADASISTANPIDGVVNCLERSRAFCDPEPLGGMYGCS